MEKRKLGDLITINLKIVDIHPGFYFTRCEAANGMGFGVAIPKEMVDAPVGEFEKCEWLEATHITNGEETFRYFPKNEMLIDEFGQYRNLSTGLAGSLGWFPVKLN